MGTLCRPSARRRALPAAGVLLALAHGGPAAAADGEPDADRPRHYAGAFVGSGRLHARIVDVDGFANWGNPGAALRYDDVELVGGLLIGRKLDVGGAPVRVEFDAAFGDVLATTNRLDPEGRDETVDLEMQWIVTAAGGLERTLGRATLFATGGLAVAGTASAVTDVDYVPGPPPRFRWDLDDSFREASADVGWMVRVGAEAALSDAWAVRLDGAYLDFGRRSRAVNRSGDNRCGPGGPRRPCAYGVETRFGLARLAIVHRFGP